MNSKFLELVDEITTERRSSYGPARRHYTKTVAMINALFDLDLAPEDWPIFMVCDKLARESESNDPDNMLDIAGYASRRAEILEEDATPPTPVIPTPAVAHVFEKKGAGGGTTERRFPPHDL